MVNEIRLSGKITAGYNGAPAVRTITKKDSDDVVGYAAQVEYQARKGRAFIDITVWDPASALGRAMAGDDITVKGSLDQDSWKTGDQWKRKATIHADFVAVPRLYTEATGDAA